MIHSYKFIRFCMEGGKDGSLEYRSEILEWRDDTQEWVEVVKMKVPRWYHAVTTINIESDVMIYCS